jgi:UDP-N-acetylmuramyl tripeptide synthase
MSRSPRLAASVAAGRSAVWLSSFLRLGKGQSIGGRVTLAVDPQALRALAEGRRIVLVTGTNGKSTTTSMVAAALGGRVCTNATGSNLPPGVVAALIGDDAPLAVFEVDELHIPRVIRDVDPEVVLLLNLSRDQLDRMHEVGRVVRAWREGLAHSAAEVIAFANDPNVVAAVPEQRATWIGAAALWDNDIGACPRCGAPLTIAGDSWFCGSCDLRPPAAAYDVTDGRVGIDGDAHALGLALPGRVNETNAAFAMAAAAHFGVAPDDAIARINAVADVAGRYARFRVGGRDARLLLAKNPASWVSALEIVDPAAQVAISINARTADGLDTSWLWDVEFERLAGRRVAALGDRRADLAVRLQYAGVTVAEVADLEEAAAVLPAGPLDVIGNYTAFDDLRRRHVR